MHNLLENNVTDSCLLVAFCPFDDYFDFFTKLNLVEIAKPSNMLIDLCFFGPKISLKSYTVQISKLSKVCGSVLGPISDQMVVGIKVDV